MAESLLHIGLESLLLEEQLQGATRNGVALKPKLRRGALTAIAFLNQHGWDLKYSLNKKTDVNGLAEIIENCAAGKVSKEKLMD